MIGIYKIENTNTGGIYIGQSVDIEKRIREHKLQLRKDIHFNPHLHHGIAQDYGQNSNMGFSIRFDGWFNKSM
jgi:hypothetical protein